MDGEVCPCGQVYWVVKVFKLVWVVRIVGAIPFSDGFVFVTEQQRQ